MKKLIILAAVLLLVFCIYLAFFHNSIASTNKLPPIFQAKNIQYKVEYGMTVLEGPWKDNYAVTSDDNYLYILNGGGYNFKNYAFDQTNKEIVIRKNVLDAKQRDTEYFQVIKIPKTKYEPLINDGKVRIKINYMYLNDSSIIFDYDAGTKQTQLVSYTFHEK